jgi:hypothetical protein
VAGHQQREDLIVDLLVGQAGAGLILGICEHPQDGAFVPGIAVPARGDLRVHRPADLLPRIGYLTPQQRTRD